ncbi:MAG: hypothetical protein P8X89_14045 [Reinekea sp.]
MDRANSNLDNIDLYCYSQTPQEDGQHSTQPETGQPSAGGLASGESGSQPASGQPYLNPNSPAQIPSSPGPDLEYLLRTPQAITLEDIIQNEAPPEPANHQPAVEKQPVKARFLAGLEAFERGASLKDCSPSLPFYDYIRSDGRLVKKGISLSKTLTAEEKERLVQAIVARNQAIATRQGARPKRLPDEDMNKEHFLAGLGKYGQGFQLKDCSATLKFKTYVTDKGRLTKAGRELRNSLPLKDRERLNQALRSRKQAAYVPVAERFLAGLDNYAQGVQLKDCSATISFRNYVSDDAHLHEQGKILFKSLSPEDQARVNRALFCRREMYLKRVMDNASVEERFLAGLDNYEKGVPVRRCSRDIYLRSYFIGDGLSYRGRVLYDKLDEDDKARVNRALTRRKEVIAQRTSGDVAKFMATLEPYGNGLNLLDCGNQSGLVGKAITYLTPEGGLTPKGELLIENLSPDQQIEVMFAIRKRRQFIDPSAQVPELLWQVLESPWQLPEMPLSMPELGGMNPTGMIDPMQTEAMWATAWQLTGQAMPGTWGIPSESAESSIPSYGSEAVGADFQHQYGPYGLMPQLAPDRLIGRGIVRDMLINIQGEVYRVHDMGGSVNPTNENPQGKKFMLVPRMRGG